MIVCRTSHWAYFLLVCPDPLFCLDFVEITNKIETCLVAVAVAEAGPRQMKMKPTQEMTFLIGRAKVLRLFTNHD